jgi:hypothetical protein
MRLRNSATTKYISCVGCKYYDYGLCKKTHEFEPITEKKMYPLASSYRNICGYKNPKHYASIDLKTFKEDIKFQNQIITTTFLITPISIVGIYLGIKYNFNIVLTSWIIMCTSGLLCVSTNEIKKLDKKRLELINESKK